MDELSVLERAMKEVEKNESYSMPSEGPKFEYIQFIQHTLALRLVFGTLLQSRVANDSFFNDLQR